MIVLTYPETVCPECDGDGYYYVMTWPTYEGDQTWRQVAFEGDQTWRRVACETCRGNGWIYDNEELDKEK